MLSRKLSPIGNMAGLEEDVAVGDVASSSKSVSIARSNAPVDLAADRNAYADAADDAAERLLIGRRGDGVGEVEE